ncbi:hypothetical protein ACOMHN_049709 [Nucella lapillus]
MGEINNEQLAQYNAYCQAVGAMLGAALGAMGADQAGRRKPLYVYFPFMLIAHILSGFAVSWTMLAVFRFFVGAFAAYQVKMAMMFRLGCSFRDVQIGMFFPDQPYQVKMAVMFRLGCSFLTSFTKSKWP